MLNYLVTGSKGQLAKCFRLIQPEFFHYKLLFTSKSEVDITKEKTLSNFFKKHPFEGIINCAAYTQVDQAEIDFNEAYRTNVQGIKTLIQFSEVNNLKLINFSTDFVFDGINKGEYTEKDKTNPLNCYGKTKREGEVYLEKAKCQSVNFRTSWLYSPFGENFVRKIIKNCKFKTSLKVVDDQFGKPTYGVDLARFVLSSIGHPDLFKHKTYHFAQGPKTTWFDFARKIIELIGSESELKPIQSSAYNTLAKRPFNSALDTRLIENSLSLKIRSWELALKDYLKIIKHNELI